MVVFTSYAISKKSGLFFFFFFNHKNYWNWFHIYLLRWQMLSVKFGAL